MLCLVWQLSSEQVGGGHEGPTWAGHGIDGGAIEGGYGSDTMHGTHL